MDAITFEFNTIMQMVAFSCWAIYGAMMISRLRRI